MARQVRESAFQWDWINGGARPAARSLIARPRFLDAWDGADLFDEEVDQQPDTRDARALRDDQEAQRDRRQGIIGEDHLKPTSRQKIIDKPSVSGRDAPSRNHGLAGGEPMIDPQTTVEDEPFFHPETSRIDGVTLMGFASMNDVEEFLQTDGYVVIMESERALSILDAGAYWTALNFGIVNRIHAETATRRT